MSNPGNKMGVMHLTILTAVNMLGSGIIMLPTKLAEVGTMSILSWLVTALGSLALAWAFQNVVYLVRKAAGWEDTPSMRLENRVTLLLIIPTQ
jgi:hypothetical protein